VLEGIEFRVLRVARRRIELLRVVTPEEVLLPAERSAAENAVPAPASPDSEA